ncbi:hypothetical protein BKA62DRAFT_733285 [Auriculariales sp. MPI-PUGE-AT-0066]|nr:hypothetical protein BKA62DRAFT_733285 [Auriculariales sp. MPI-PUGE-AT-0066]
MQLSDSRRRRKNDGMKPSLAFPTLLSLFFHQAHKAMATCGTDAPIGLCCMGVALYSTNAGVWGPICGFNPPDNPLVGARCIAYNATSGCPSGSIGTCCKNVISGREILSNSRLIECALGTYCGGTPSPDLTSSTASSVSVPTITLTSSELSTITAPTTTLPLATTSTSAFATANPTVLPDGWYTAGPCVILNSFSNLSITASWSLNTPGGCAQYCSTAPGGDIAPYTVAGVANKYDCHCGYDYQYIFADRAYTEECDQPCPGDATQTCGRWDRIQIYSSIPREEMFLGNPQGVWEQLHECAVDTPEQMVPGNCRFYCESLGPEYTYVRVWNGLRGVVQEAPFYECDTKCPWRIKTFTKVTGA